MKLPLATDPYADIERETRIPVRSNIIPLVHDHIFKQLCPLHGAQAQIIAHVLNKLHEQLLTDPLTDAFRTTKPDGSVRFFYDDGVITALAAIVDRCSFAGPSDTQHIRSADSELVGNDGRQGVGGEHDTGPNSRIRDPREDVADFGSDSSSQTSIDPEGFKKLAQAIYKG